MIQINHSFNGRAISTYTGESIELTLAENASTGYRWSFAAVPGSNGHPVLRTLETTPHATGKPPGRPGLRCLYFEAAMAGDAELKLEYRRSWEESARPARSFVLRVSVAPAEHP